MEFVSILTNFEPAVVETMAWGVKLYERAEALSEAADVPVSFVEEALAACKWSGKTVKFNVDHPSLPAFWAEIGVIGVKADSIWGVVLSDSVVADSVVRRYSEHGLVEDQTVLSMISPDFSNVALLRVVDRTSVVLVAGSVKGEFGEGGNIEVDQAVLELLAFQG